MSNTNNTLIVWLLSGCCFMLGCCQQFILGVPSLVAESCGTTVSGVGQLMTVFGVANGIGTPIALALLSRVDQKVQMLTGTGVMFFGMLATAVTSVYGILMGVRVAMGVGHGVFVALAYTVAQRVAPSGRQGAYMANIALGFSLAQVTAIPLARVACGFVDWHMLYGALAVLALVAFATILKVVPWQDPAERSDKSSSVSALVKPLSDRAVLIAVAGTLLVQLGYMGLYTYITPFMEEALAGHSSEFVSGVLLVAGLMSIVGTKGSGYIADRAGSRRTLLGGVALCVLSYAGMLLFHGSEVGIIACVFTWIIGAWSYVPLQNLLLTKRCPQYASIVISLTTSSLQLGGAIGSGVGGIYISYLPLMSLPVLGVVGGLAGLALEARMTQMVEKGAGIKER